MTRAAQQARCMEAAVATPRHLSRAQAQEARELAWALCKLLCSPTNATEAAADYKRTIDMIDEREMP